MRELMTQKLASVGTVQGSYLCVMRGGGGEGRRREEGRGQQAKANTYARFIATNCRDSYSKES